MASDFVALFERIRERCRQQRWFGPDAEHPSSWWSQHRVTYDPQTGQYRSQNPWSDSRIGVFAYPPASEEQLRITESALGFPLPQVLREMYAQVANGGFGPGYGLVGVSGGFPSDGATLSIGDWQIPTAAARTLKEFPDCYLECDSEPDGLMTLCHWGCGIFSVLDSRTGHVFTSAGYARRGTELDHQDVDPNDIVEGLQYQADSIEEWFEKWLADDLHQGDARVSILLDEVDDLSTRIAERRAAAKQREEQLLAAYYADSPDLAALNRLRFKGIYRVPRGGPLPPVVLPSTEERDVNLSEEAKAHHLILFFYPGDNAGQHYPQLAGCIEEAYAFRDVIAQLHALNAVVFGISLQPTEQQRQFVDREHLMFALLSDKRRQLVSALGIPRCVAEDGEEFVARTTLVIEKGGRIAEVYPDGQLKGRVEAVLAAVRRLAVQGDVNSDEMLFSFGDPHDDIPY